MGQTSLHEINLKNGTYTVGFNHYLAYDSTRTYQRIYDWNNQHIPRPISVSMWYPSKETPNSKDALKVLDYMEILKEEEEWEYLPNEHILNWFYYSNTPSNQKHLTESCTAFMNPEPANDKFPVVIYAPSYQASSIENFALCEYLASHGYIVISSPSRGTDNRFLEGGTERDMETQARDIEFLIREIARMPAADTEHIASMGFSFGGLSNVLVQMRNGNIKAIVSLDGSIKYQYPTLQKSPFFKLDRFNVPFIHMAQKDIPQHVLEEDKIKPELNTQFEFFDSLLYSQAYQLKFHDLTHAYFSTLGVLFQTRDLRQDKSDAAIMRSYRWVAKYSLKFLDAFLKNDSTAQAFMDRPPADNEVSKGLVSLTSKFPKQGPFTFQDFNELAAQADYGLLEEMYEAIRLKHPSLELPEGRLNNLGLQLAFNPQTSQQGINVFHLATYIYPNSANLYDSLAEAYLFMGEQELAILNFKKSLELDAQNQNAIDRLQQLTE